ncbi:MAG: glycosyltransferase family 2 protein [Candidatus Eremiobacteraeota bacterium]|nr:glycosyltransferase family 2 protein [Candidatus Eremiobacteraeota bacterium]
MSRASYVLPIRASDARHAGELREYFLSLREVDIIVVDASARDVFAAHEAEWRGAVALHVPPEPLIRGSNGKARGVLSGLKLARHDRVVIADDDVRYSEATLARVIEALDCADVVRPQNYFAPVPWHALLDTARTLINRVTGGDWPGTLAVRRSKLPDGYNPNVLFENLELVRTVRANGGREVRLDDCYVERRPPTTAHYWSQRIRQAYDEFARPSRLLAQLAILPLLFLCIAFRRPDAIALGSLIAMLMAEVGRRAHGGRRYFSVLSSLCAPLWLLERGCCSWAALYARACRGGMWYAGSLIREAASMPSKLAQQGT